MAMNACRLLGLLICGDLATSQHDSCMPLFPMSFNSINAQQTLGSFPPISIQHAKRHQLEAVLSRQLTVIVDCSLKSRLEGKELGWIVSSAN